LFVGQQAVLQSHRGWDPGTLQLGRRLSRHFSLPLPVTGVSRLLIEVNRSLHHPRLFSEYSQGLSPDCKQKLVERYYWPYRRQVTEMIEDGLKRGTWVWHVSLHSFIGDWNGAPRTADIGLLYDPARESERDLCRVWQAELAACLPQLRIRRNYPYLGKADGLTTALRRTFAGRPYVGVELEVNQRWIYPGSPVWRQIQAAVAQTMERLAERKF
jgi:predicted N-formylglutamate amidohydrolase